MDNKSLFKRILYIALDVLRKALPILLIAAIFAMSAYVITEELYKPSYTTETTFVVSTRSSSTDPYKNLTAAKKLADVFGTILKSNELKRLILLETGWDSLPGEVSTGGIEETNILTLSVTADNPRNSFLMMKAILNIYGTIAGKVLDESAVLKEYSAPRVPEFPDNSSKSVRNAAIAGVIGMILGIAGIAALSYFSKAVRDVKDIQTTLGTGVIAVVPNEKGRKRGVDIDKIPVLITDIRRSTSYIEAIKSIRIKVENQNKSSGHKVFTVTSSWSGEGKSTIAANLALALAQKEYKVVLVDLDTRNPSQNEIFKGKVISSNTLSAFTENFKASELIKDSGSHMTFIFADRESLSVSELSAAFSNLKNEFDFVIVDTPPMMLVSDSVTVSDYADASMLVVRENAESIDEAANSIDMLRSCRSQFLGCIYNAEILRDSGVSTYGKYGNYGKYGKYGKYGSYSKYSRYSSYGRFNEAGTQTVAQAEPENNEKESSDSSDDDKIEL